MNIIEMRKKRWVDFYNSDNASLVLVHDSEEGRPLPYISNNAKRIKWSIERYARQMDFIHRLDDDRIPYLSPYTGTEIFAQAFGAKVYGTQDNMPTCYPVIHNSKELAHLKMPELSKSSLTEMFEIADALRSAAPEGILALPDIQSPLDIAALIWSKEDFFLAMVDEPEAVHALIGMVNRLLIEFLDLWFERYGKDFIAHYPDYYMPFGVTLSEDEIGIINSDMFKAFTLDVLNGLSRRYGQIGIHCCANARHQWENFKAVSGLCLINFVQPAEVIDEAYHEFKGVCAQMHSSNPVHPNRFSKDGLYSGRIIWRCYADDISGAIEQVKTLRDLAGKYMAKADTDEC